MRERYINREEVLPSEFDPTALYAVAGHRERDSACAISHMLGLYPYGTGYNNLTLDQQKNAVPPTQIGESLKQEIQDSLKQNALRDGYVPVPIHQRLGNPFDMRFDGFNSKTCPSISAAQSAYFNKQNPEIKSKFEEDLFPKLQSILNLPNAVDWVSAPQIVNEILTN